MYLHHDLFPETTQPKYYEDAFRNILEAHLSYLRGHSTTTYVSVDPGNAYKYEYNLYLLLESLNYPEHLHWLIMRLSGLTSPYDMRENFTTLVVPDQNIVEQLKSNASTINRLT